MQEHIDHPRPPASAGPWLWTRRRFLGGSVLAGAGVWTASRWVDALAESATHAAMRPALPSIESFLNREGIEELLRIALSHGAEFSEVYGEYTITTEVTLDESTLKTLSYGVLSGVGIRAIQGEVTGYAYADDFDMKSLRDAARTAAGVASSGSAKQITALRAGDARPPFRLEHPAPMTRGEADKVDLVRRADAAGRAVDPRVHN